MLVCVVTSGLLLASCARTFSVRLSRPEGELFILFDRALVQIDAVRGDTTDSGWKLNDYRRSGQWGWGELNMFVRSWLRSAGFGGWSYTRDIGGGLIWPPPKASLPGYVVFFPLWPLAIVSLLLASTWAIRRRRGGVGICCENCSYNLTGNTSGVCPECGTQTPAKVRA